MGGRFINPFFLKGFSVSAPLASDLQNDFCKMGLLSRMVQTARPLILVADADGEAAWLLAKHFLRQGYRALHTQRGEDALRLARFGALDAAIVDVSLEDMAGHTLAARLRELDPEIPILMTAGDYRPELEARARQLGILYYAHKPADCRLLEAVVAKALDRRGVKMPGVQGRRRCTT